MPSKEGHSLNNPRSARMTVRTSLSPVSNLSNTKRKLTGMLTASNLTPTYKNDFNRCQAIDSQLFKQASTPTSANYIDTMQRSTSYSKLTSPRPCYSKMPQLKQTLSKRKTKSPTRY